MTNTSANAIIIDLQAFITNFLKPTNTSLPGEKEYINMQIVIQPN